MKTLTQERCHIHNVFDGQQIINLCRIEVQLFILGILCEKWRTSIVASLSMSAFGFSYTNDSYSFRMHDFQGHPLHPSKVNSVRLIKKIQWACFTLGTLHMMFYFSKLKCMLLGATKTFSAPFFFIGCCTQRVLFKAML